ncbi:hypothetical protein ASE04_09450 [Rhizobium sp. Root708]|nr:hypothetical protein ASE04_09450 [Rhizobium sp. Root708]
MGDDESAQAAKAVILGNRLVENLRTASVISRQQRDVNRSPDPVLKITAVASSGLVTDQDH